MKIIRVYGITGHGKGEVNYAGGLTKVAMWRKVDAGRKLRKSESIVDFLREWGSYIISIAKTVSKKIEVLICSISSFS